MSKDSNYLLLRTEQNPNYFSGLVDPVKKSAPSFLSYKTIKQKNEIGNFWVKTEPKWRRELVNLDTGENYTSTDFTSACKRKISVVNAFTSAYATRYHRKNVSLLFHTLTAVNLANYSGIKPMLEAIKYRYEMVERKLLGYVWNLECTERFHVHYHLCTAVDRLNVKRIPASLKLEGLWGARTGVEFVTGNVYGYMQKKGMFDYMGKHGNIYAKYQVRRQATDFSPKEGGKLRVMRMSGRSRKFT